MKLSLTTPYKSIKSLTETDLPSFTVLSGRNGSGKSHLLEAIEKGDIAILSDDDTPVAESDVRLFTWTNLAVNTEVAHDATEEWKQRRHLADVLDDVTRAHRDAIENAIALYVPKASRIRGNRLRSLNKSSMKEVVADVAQLDVALAALEQALRNLRGEVLAALEGDRRINETRVAFLERVSGKPILGIARSWLLYDAPLAMDEADIFQQRTAQVFANWQQAQTENRINKYLSEEFPDEYDDGEADWISEEDFSRRFGIPPWELVNSILDEAQLDFRVEPPHKKLSSPYTPRLLHANGAEISFADVSSGEQVLMAVGLMLYQADEGRMVSNFPRVLLLDEIDAPLHPSMIRQVLAALQGVLVEARGVNVVLATHQPTTAALAPETSLFSMDKEEPRIRKTTRDEAIRFLTAGIPTLSVKSEDRRVVYVESNSDVSRYEALVEHLDSQINGPMRPVFLATGPKPASSEPETNTGSTRVRSAVKGLREAGVEAFGVIDGDGKTGDTPVGILVLGGARRYSIDNYLLDPLLVAGLLIHKRWFDRVTLADMGLPEHGSSWHGIGDAEAAILQQVADSIINECFGAEHGSLVASTLVNGIEIKLPEQFLSMNGHDWYALLQDKFPQINQLGSERHMQKDILDKVVRYLPGLVSSDLVETLNYLHADTLE